MHAYLMHTRSHYRELICICWDQDPENRPSFKQVGGAVHAYLSHTRTYTCGHLTHVVWMYFVDLMTVGPA